MGQIYLCSAPNRADDDEILTLLKTELASNHRLLPALSVTPPYKATQKRSINRHLRQASHILFIFSAEAYASVECYTVLRYALDKKIPIIPVSWGEERIDVNSLTIDLADWQENSRNSVMEKIRNIQQTVNQRNWVRFAQYRVSGKTKQEPLRRRLLRDLLTAIENPVPTWTAFVSYAREDNKFVLPFKEQLGALTPVWFDMDEIPAAKDWQQEINRGIEKSHNFIFIASTASLTSPNCHHEVKHARQHNKRLIPIILEPYDATKASNHLDKDPWENLPTSEALPYARATWEWIKNNTSPADISHLTVGTSGLTDDLLTEVDTRFRHDSVYINEHTRYLVRAVNQDYLGWRELPAYWLWQRRNIHKSNPPSNAHRAFFRHSVGRKVRFAVLTTLIVGILLTGIGLVLANARAETEASRADSEAARRQTVEVQAQEANRRLQIQASYANTIKVELPYQPAQASLVYNALWVSRGTTGVSRISLNGLENNVDVPTGNDPGLPVRGEGYLWIINQGDGTLTRIDPQTNDSQTVAVGSTPQLPVFTPHQVWVQSVIDGTLAVLDPVTLKEVAPRIKIGLNTGNAFSSSDALWTLDSNGSNLIRIDNSTFNTVSITLPAKAQNAFYHSVSDSIFVILSDSILQLNPQTGKVAHQVRLPSAPSVIKSTEDALWATFLDGSGFARIDPQTLDVQKVDGNGIVDLYMTDGRVWGVTDTALLLYDSKTLSLIQTIDSINNVRRLRAPVSDGHHVWFAQSERGTVFILDGQTGQRLRDLQPCANLSAPLFDGANMWFTCRDEHTVIAVPADLTFFGEQTVLKDNWTQVPQVVGDIMWVVQTGTGRIAAFDLKSGTLRAAVDLKSTALPLVYDAPYLWTGTPDAGNIIRIDTRQLDTINPLNPVIAYDTVSVGNSISNINVFEGMVWVQRLDPNNDEGFLTLLNGESLSVLKREDTLNAFGGFYYHDGTVWTSTFDLTQGYVLRLDPKTATILQREPMPVTTYASVTPLVLDNVLWLTAVMPPPTQTIRVAMQILQSTGSNNQLPFYLLGLDPTTLKVLHTFPLPIWTGTPQFEDGYFWYRQTAPVLVSGLPPQTGKGVIAVAREDGSIRGPWSVCDLDGGANLVGGKLWLGCLQAGENFGVFTHDVDTPIQLYDHIGTAPNDPAKLGNCLLFTFQDSGSAALFDVQTGKLLHTYRLGRHPYAPVIYDTSAYIYNSGSDTIQRIPLINGEEKSC